MISTQASDRSVRFLPEPLTVEEAGLDYGLILDLCLKVIHFGGRPSARMICDRTCLSFAIIEAALTFLRNEGFIDIVGAAGVTEQDYRYALTSKGSAKAQEVLEANHYVGPAPVPFDLYADVVSRQSISALDVTPDQIESAFSGLVFGEDTLAQLGTAVGSGRSIFLYGPPGDGKSTIAECLRLMLLDTILVPYAIEQSGQIVRVYDDRAGLSAGSFTHLEPAASKHLDDETIVAPGDGRDRRWAIAHRPLVFHGGELTMSDFELRYSPAGKFYVAPAQLVANNGVLVIDDFGRQRARPDEILNRLMIPMDRGIDHLTFETGETFAAPFDVMLVFATNLSPSGLGDEAFFRRIRHKVFVPDPDEGRFREILRRSTADAGLVYSDAAADHLVHQHYRETGRPFRGVHPRDIVNLIKDMARFRQQPPAFTPEWIDRACNSYFTKD